MPERFGQTALQRRYVTQEQLQECLAGRQRAQEEGETLSLEQILLQRGYITREQYRWILEEQGIRLLSCDSCRKMYEIQGAVEEGTRCARCGRELIPVDRSRPDLLQTDTSHQGPADAGIRGNQTGLRLGKYAIVEEIARGGMGIVYQAYDPDLKSRVALKILKDSDAHTAVVTRFHREAILARQLRHPNIVTIYDVGTAGSVHFIAMEYVDGRPLSAMLPTGEVARGEGIKIIEAVARAIDYAHTREIIHRDLKPDNLILEKSGRVVITDFGLARMLTGVTQLTVEGSTLGTPNYMSPEQVAGRLWEVDKQTDVYALGVILYEMLTRQRPFDGTTVAEVFRKIQGEEPQRLRRIDPTIPLELETICLKAMARDRGRRYAGALELAEDLARYGRGEPILARPPSLVYTLRKRLARSRAAVVTGVAAIVVILGILGVQDWRRRAVEGERIRSELRKKEVRDRATPLYQKAQWIERQYQEELSSSPHDIRPLRERLREAERHLNEVLTIDPDFNEARMLRGEIQVHLGNVDSALEDMGEVIRREPGFWRAYVSKIQILLQFYGNPCSTRGQPLSEVNLQKRAAEIQEIRKEILSGLEKALNLISEPVVKDYVDLLFDYHTRRRSAGEMLELCEERSRSGVMRTNFTRLSAEIWWNLVNDAYGAQDFERARDPYLKAIEIWEELRARFPMDIGLYGRLSEPYLCLPVFFAPEEREKLYPQYLRFLDDWVTVEPDYSGVRIARAKCCIGMGRFGEAEEDFGKAMELDPRSPLPYLDRAWMYLERAKELDPLADKAGRDIDEALKRDPSQWSAYHARYKVHLYKRQYEEALKDIDRAIELNRRVRWAWDLLWEQGCIMRAKALNALKRYDEAIQECDKVMASDPSLLGAYEERAFARFWKGELDGALEDCEFALGKLPDFYRGHLMRGFVYLDRGEYGKALQDGKAALELRPESSEPYQLCGVAAYGSGDYEGAWEYLSQVYRMETGQSIQPRGNERSIQAATRFLEMTIQRIEDRHPLKGAIRALLDRTRVGSHDRY